MSSKTLRTKARGWRAQWAMLESIPGSEPALSHVSYLDLRGVLSSAIPGYKQSWGNELHPTKPGFDAVALEFRKRLVSFPLP